MANFKRYDGYVNSIPQRMIDSSLPVCPFCRSNAPHWLLASKLDMMGGRTLYRCERCGATLSGSAIDAAADGGKQFAFNPAMAGLNAAKKGSKGQEVGISYFRVEELGSVCKDSSLIGQELPLPQLKIMSGYQEPSFGQAAPEADPGEVTVCVNTPAPQVDPGEATVCVNPTAPQPVAQQPVYAAPQQPQYPPQQPVYQQPVYQQPVYQQPPQAPVYQQAPAAPAQEKKSAAAIVFPILSAVFALLALLLSIFAGQIYHSFIMAGAPVYVIILAVSIVRIIFCIPSLVFGIIGLIKSIKAKKIVGIILAALGLLLALYVLITACSSISNIARFI